MKKIALIAFAAILGCTAAMAQNEHIHLFHNTKEFKTHKSAEIQSMTYEGNSTTGYTHLVVTDTNGKTTRYDLNNIDSVMVRTTGLPRFFFNLQDYPGWTELQGSKDDIHPTTMRMEGNGMYADLDEQTVEFRGRGNSTWNMAKKPYRFKMESKAKVCGLKKSKSFALIANFLDGTLMRNAIALWVANYLEMPFANHCVPVEVYVNDNYKGAYMLTEKIGIGGGSVDIDEYKGMLFELDSNYDEDFKFMYYGSGNTTGSITLPIMVKDPAIAEIVDSLGTTSDEYFNLWRNDFTNFANAICTRSANQSLRDVLDLEEAVKYFMVNSIANNHEMKHPKSMYINKDSLNGEALYRFGPCWDFDWAYTYDSYEGASATIPLVSVNGDRSGASFCKELFKNQEFRTLYKEKWDEFVAEGYPQLLQYIEEYANLIEPLALSNGLVWTEAITGQRNALCSYNFRANLDTLKKWLDQRINYCNTNANFGLY